MTKNHCLFFIKTQKLYKVNDKIEIKGGYFCSKLLSKNKIYRYIVYVGQWLSVKRFFLVKKCCFCIFFEHIMSQNMMEKKNIVFSNSDFFVFHDKTKIFFRYGILQKEERLSEIKNNTIFLQNFPIFFCKLSKSLINQIFCLFSIAFYRKKGIMIEV